MSTLTTMTRSVAATVVIAGLILALADAAAQQPAQGQSSEITARPITLPGSLSTPDGQVPIQLAMAEEENDSASNEMRARLARMKEQAPNISLTIFPGLIKQVEKQGFVPGVAELMALFFERAGVKKVEVSEDLFRPSAPDDVWKISREFGRFVQDKPVETDYAVFAEVIGTPQTGPDKILTVVVDKAGDPVCVEADYAAFAEVIGMPKTEADKIFSVVVDKARHPVWVDAQSGTDEKASKRAAEQRDVPEK